MGKGAGIPVVGGTVLNVRLASVPAGVRVTLIVCAAAAFDVHFYAVPSRRLALSLVLVAAVLGGLGMGLLPWDRIVRSRWREPAFLAWSLSNVATITLFCFINNAPNSALSLLFFVPIVFVSTTYPLRSVVIVGVASLCCCVAVASHAGSSPDFVVMFAAVLGLNRRGFEEHAEEAIRRAASAEGTLAVILVDLDGFKQVNDSSGHAAGDQVLRDVTVRLADAAGPDGLIGRLGGDEFAVLLHGVDGAGALADGERLEAALADVTRASVGVAAMPHHGTALDALLSWADRRLYETKLSRRAGEITLPGLEFVAGDLIA